jgi:mono/diheme cytochrome c family protein
LIPVTRARVVLCGLAVLLVLDAGRSYYARVGYAHPSEAWQPDPAIYADLMWPPGTDGRPDLPLGQRVYARRCAVCHGPDGRGNGPAAPSMMPRPRDFTLGLFKYKSTLRSEPPTDDDLRRVVTGGLGASAMPSFGDLLTDSEIRAVVDEVKRLARITDSAITPVAIAAQTAEDEASIGRGRALYVRLECGGCHGADGRNAGFLQDAKNRPVPIRDLTAPWTFRGGSKPEEVWLRLTTGLAGSSMPAYVDAASPGERWDLVNHLRSIARVAPWEPGGRLDGPGHLPDLLKRGEYLVHAEMCGLCHTQINRTGIYRDDRYLAGGMRVGAYPHAVFVSFNLTSDADTGLGRWTEEQIVEVFRSGRAPDRQLNLWGMPWFYFHYFTPEDARAVARYLKSQPPMRNEIPRPLRYGVVETVVSKALRPLPAANPTVLTYADGNFARSARRAERPQQGLIAAQWLVLALGAASFFVITIRDRRWPRTTTGWIGAGFATLGLFAGGTLIWMFYELPALSFIPPEQIVQGATAGIPTPDPAHLTPEERAMTARGQYLFEVASCAFCHNPNGSGGQKISWRPFGTLWVRNITPDVDTGIGAWTDSAIARAIRSGVTPDGRVLHWQGMIWDHASNWDEEDIRSLVAYLRKIPPVRRAVPPARPPSPDDCEIYTFWVGPSSVAGCKPSR